MNDRQTTRWSEPMAFAIVFITLVCHYVWKWVPESKQADVWNISLALYSVVMTVIIGFIFNSRAVWLAVALSVGYFLQVAGCSAAYLISPWVVIPGQEQCSAATGIPLGTLGLAAALIVLPKIIKQG